MNKLKILNAVKKKYITEKYFSDWIGDYYSIYCFGYESDYCLELGFLKENKTIDLVVKIDSTVLNSIRRKAIAEELEKKYGNIKYVDGVFGILNVDENNVIGKIETLKEAMLYASKLPICENTKFKNLENGD